jgi:hypothetical protein
VARPAHQNALAVAIRHLAAEKSPACLLDASGTFLFVNDAWDRRAVDAGAEPRDLGSSLIGTAWLDRVPPGEVRCRHALLLDEALRRPAARRRTQMGEANTATRAALVSTRFEPVLAQGSEPIGVAVVETVVRERPIEEVYDVAGRPAEAYLDASGRFTQCPCCRRVRDPGDPERWEVVPALVAARDGEPVLCELCVELHYPPR